MKPDNPASVTATLTSDRRLEGLDGLRAVAAMLVVAYHVALTSGLARSGPLAPVASELKGGVTIFFVISGFVLYMPYARALRGGGDLPDWRQYARRRAVRILPAYWVALTVWGLFGTAAGPAMGLGWWRYYGLSQIYRPDTMLGGLGVAWSLCVEVSFYLLLPFLARALAALIRRFGGDRPARVQLAAVAVLALGSLAERGVLAHSIFAPVSSERLVAATVLPSLLDWFAIGIGLAVIFVEWELKPGRFSLLAKLAARPVLCWLLAAGCYLTGAAMQQGDQFLPLYGIGTHVALGIASGFLVLPLLSPSVQTWPIRALSWPFASWLGAISYGIYLWHGQVLTAVSPWIHRVPWLKAGVPEALVLFVVVGAGGISLGAASWYLVERPARRIAARASRARPALAAITPLVHQDPAQAS